MRTRLFRHRLFRFTYQMVVGLTALLAIGCNVPRDPEQTLERVRKSPLRVGVSAYEPWTRWEGVERESPSGIEVELVEEFAEHLDTEVRWIRGSETQLLTALEEFEIDLVIGGLTEDTLWSDRVGLSAPFAETDAGTHVFAVPPGENGFLLKLDKFLKGRGGEFQKRMWETATERKASEP